MDNPIVYIRADTVQSISQVGYYRLNYLIGVEEQFDYHFNESANLITGLLLETEKLARDFSGIYSSYPEIVSSKPAEPDFKKNLLISLYTQSQSKFIRFIGLTTGFRLDNSLYYGMVFRSAIGKKSQLFLDYSIKSEGIET